MHSYQEAYEDSEADRITHSPTYGGGGENSPQTPRFPVSPQTPYFNMCRLALSKTLNTLVFTFYLFIFSALYISRTTKTSEELQQIWKHAAGFHISGSDTETKLLVTDEGKSVVTVTGFPFT